MHPLIGLVIFSLLFALLIWGGNRLFANFEKKIDRQFQALGREMGLGLEKTTPPFPGRTWIAPSLEGVRAGHRVRIFMEETRAGDNRNQKTIIEIHHDSGSFQSFKCCRKLLLSNLLKLTANVKTGDAAFDKVFILWSRPPGQLPDWFDAPMQSSFMACRKDFNTGLLTCENRMVRFETPFFIFNDAMRNGLMKIFNLMERISEAELSKQ